MTKGDQIYYPDAVSAVKTLLGYFGEDVSREGLKETPVRVVKAWMEMLGGYRVNVSQIFKLFDDPCDEMVILRGCRLASQCEHHLLPFMGVAHVGYIPCGKILGLSKMARVVEAFSRRLQVQERLTSEIVTAIEKHVPNKGVACIIEASHLCMACRGVRQQDSIMVTSKMTGAFRDKPEARSEFMSLIKG